MARDAVATMGEVLSDDAGGRDAVHVAVFSATSADRVYPGQHLTVLGRGERDAVVTPRGTNDVAIADPFLAHAAEPGDRFWAYLYPRTITALSHRWSHPAFGDDAGTTYSTPAAVIDHERWLRDWCAANDCPGYESVMAMAARVADGAEAVWDGSVTFQGEDAHCEVPPEFWDHAEAVLGRRVGGERPTYFSCSC